MLRQLIWPITFEHECCWEMLHLSIVGSRAQVRLWSGVHTWSRLMPLGVAFLLGV
jgi:hypothetical protein